MSFIKIKSKKDSLYKTMRFYMLIQLLFGFDHNYINTNSKIIKYLIKFTCITICVVQSYMILINIYYNTNFTTALWYYMIVIDYVVTVLVILFVKASVADFTKALQEIDLKLNIKSRHYIFVHIRIILFTTMTIGFRAVYSDLYCTWFPNDCVHYEDIYLIVYSVVSSLDVIRIVIIMIFFIVYYRVKLIRVHLEIKYEDNRSLWFKEHLNSGLSLKDLSGLRKIYKTLADVEDMVKPLIDALVSFII